LLALAKGRPADGQLISRTISRRSGKKRDRYWLAHHVERLCAEAEVPVVCTQSLRGLHASVATEAGATSHVVASALGHSSPAVTHAHYIDGATARRVRTRRVIGKVAPDPALRVVGDEPATATAPASKALRKRAAHDGGNVAPDPALRVAGDEPVTAATATATAAAETGTTGALRMPTRRGSGMAAKPALRVVGSDAATTAATPAEPSSSVDLMGNGQ
ncbi:MAG TPA: hypothetical protein VK601_00365, partial [Kofleriaceae bacterium]|nr:hypothetical protein [Kofleriaceae bacterium]